MRRTILLECVLSFVSAFFGGVLAFSLVVPSQATAQSNQLQEVRASAFTLVGADGTVLATLAPGNNATGNLSLHDSTGTRRLSITGRGLIAVHDQDGTRLSFAAGRTFDQAPPIGSPLNGVLLGEGGSIGLLPTLP